MRAVILLSHGSVLCGAERNLIELAGSLAGRVEAGIVEAAFLNYSRPLFENVIEGAAAQGAIQIDVVPYFLVAGTFVADELPGRIESLRGRFPRVRFRVADAIRYHHRLADAVLACAERPRVPSFRRDHAVAQASRFCRNSPQCPIYETDACPRRAREVPA